MTDYKELIARLRDADLYNAEHYERDPLHKQAADRIQAMTEQLTAARDDAKEAEAYAEELERELRDTQDRANAFATKEYYTEMRAERAEAKLAKAVEIGNKMAHSIEGNYYLPNIAGEWRKVAAEIKGESHE